MIGTDDRSATRMEKKREIPAWRPEDIVEIPAGNVDENYDSDDYETDRYDSGGYDDDDNDDDDYEKRVPA